MATAPEIMKSVSKVTGVPQSTVRTIVRRLGESGLVPRGTRGRQPSDVSSEDIARILLGVMSVTDGIAGTSARVVQAVEQIGSLECRGSLRMALTDAIYALDHPILVVRQGSFLDQLTHLIECCAGPDTTSDLLALVGSVGLTFGRGGTHGWTELRNAEAEFPEGDLRFGPSIGDLRRVNFGDADPATLGGMTREVRLSIDALAELASIALPCSARSGFGHA